jgi:hypothetical protein
VDTQTDENNCGACGVVCTGGNQCTGGACACPPTLSSCGNQCTNKQVDRNNCGACGNVCSSDQRCVGGTCTGKTDAGVDSGVSDAGLIDAGDAGDAGL